MRRVATDSGLYEMGNPVLGIKGTPVSHFFNDVQEEIARTIEAAGLTLDGAKFDQLLTAFSILSYEVVQPERYGAKGDGISDDTAAIVEMLAENAGKYISFKSGKTYLVDGSLLKFFSGTTISGYGATLKLKAGNYTAPTYFLGNDNTITYDPLDPFTYNVRIFGLTLDGNIANVVTTKSCTGIHIYKLRGFVMEDVTIKDLPGEVGGGYGFITSMGADVYLNRCRFGRTDRSNLYLWESLNCHVLNCVMEGSYYRDCMSIGTMTPVQYQATTFTVRDCQMSTPLATSTHGLRCSGNVIGSIEDCDITGYLMDDGGGSGAEAVVTVTGGVITDVQPAPGKTGTGYVTPPAVHIPGGGGRIAQVRSVLTGDGVTGYIIDDGGDGYDDDPENPPKARVGTGTEGLYFTNILPQYVRVSRVRVNNAHYGVFVESAADKWLQFSDLEIGLTASVRYGFKSTATDCKIKINGGAIKATKQPLYIGFSPNFAVIGAALIGGNMSSSLFPVAGGTAVFMGCTLTGNTSASYALLVAGDAAADPLIACNTVVGNTVNQIRMTQGGYAVGNTPGVVNTSTAKVAGKGTYTNDNAAAGDIGQFVSAAVASGAAVALATNTGANVTSISLTAGDWDVEGNVNLTAAAATVTSMSAGVSSASAAIPTDGSEIYSGQQTVTTSMTTSLTLPRKRISLAATTTIYLAVKSTFSAGAMSAFGTITARRAR